MTTVYREDLISYVYCSRATPKILAADIARIIESATKWNPEMEITGVLTYGGGMFLQWLEGPHHFVYELMARIRKDPRHDCVLQLHSISGIQTRLYPDWSMELVQPQDIRFLLEQAIAKTNNPKHAQAIKMLLELFEDGLLRPIVL